MSKRLVMPAPSDPSVDLYEPMREQLERDIAMLMRLVEIGEEMARILDREERAGSLPPCPKAKRRADREMKALNATIRSLNRLAENLPPRAAPSPDHSHDLGDSPSTAPSATSAAPVAGDHGFQSGRRRTWKAVEMEAFFGDGRTITLN